jgi:glycosyltransferase involved in cell wall biosynthesis
MTNYQNRRVSVVVPNFNYSNYLKKRIDTIVNQTYPIYEIIIIDDCSTDDSREVIDGIIRKLSRTNPEMNVRFIENEKNSGRSILQWKKAFEEAKGDYIWIAEADDSSSRKFLENVMQPFMKDDEVVLSYAESRIVSSNGIMIAPNFKFSRDKEKTGHYRRSYIKDGKDEIREIMSIRCTIPNVSSVIFVNSKTIPYTKYLDEANEFKQSGDWYFYLKVLEHGKIAYTAKSLNRFRIHRGSTTNNNKKTSIMEKETAQIQKMLLDQYEISDFVKNAMQAELQRIIKRNTN